MEYAKLCLKFIVVVSSMLCFSLLSMVSLDPTKICTGKKKYSNDDKDCYIEIMYEDKHAFSILENDMPLFDITLADATNSHRFINYKSYDIQHIANINNITISKRYNDLVTADPDDISLQKISGIFLDDYQVKFIWDNAVYKISKSLFKELQKLKALAQKKRNKIQINMNALLDDQKDLKLKLSACFWLIENQTPRDNTTTCIVCMDARRDIVFKPCNHLCTCKACASQLEKVCPLCRQEITAEEKIYW